MITAEEFFTLFLEELKEIPALRRSYRFLNSPPSSSMFRFRKEYFCRRLEYLLKHLPPPGSRIWDCGCGYGTSAIFMTLNGYEVFGNTVEFYLQPLEARLRYWEKVKNLDSLRMQHANLFDMDIPGKFDCIVVQDTLHHLEPISKALDILSAGLAPGGRLIAIEENGHCFPQTIKNFLRRGNKKIIEVYDPVTGKNFLMGNENIRSLNEWKQLFASHMMPVNRLSVEYIRLFLPFFYALFPSGVLKEKENNLWKKHPFLREYFYFGLNFVACKNPSPPSGQR